MLGLLVAWALPLTRGVGGRDPHDLVVMAVVCLLALPLLGIWQTSTVSLAAAVAVAGAALLVCVLAPTGWYGSDVAAGYVVAAAVFVGARRYVRGDERRLLVASGICLAGIAQFGMAFLPWWGGRNPADAMTGTFYWYNPYAAFLLPGAIIGIGLVVQNRSPYRSIGWAAAPLCCAGIVFSGSRATLATLVAAWLVMALFTVRSRPAAVKALSLLTLVIGVVLALPGPPLFPHWTQPFQSAVTRAAQGQSLGQNGHYRTEFWREAWEVFRHHPWVGSGFHGLVSASRLYTPGGWVRSQLAHDGYLQAMTDGGVLLAVPFLLTVAVSALISTATALRQRARRGAAGDPLRVAVAVAVLGCLAHSAVDFDWSHPSNLVSMGLLVACVLPGVSTHRVPAALPSRAWRWLLTGGLLACLVVCLPALAAWQRQAMAGTAYGDRAQSSSAVLDTASGPFGDYRPAVVVLQRAAVGEESNPTTVRAALRQTSREATVDIATALLRDQVEAKLGINPAAVANAKALVGSLPGDRSALAADLAAVEAAGGER